MILLRWACWVLRVEVRRADVGCRADH